MSGRRRSRRPRPKQALKGKPLDEANIRWAAQLAAEAAEPNGDQRGSEEYKRALVKTLTVRALRKAVERATEKESRYA